VYSVLAAIESPLVSGSGFCQDHSPSYLKENGFDAPSDECYTNGNCLDKAACELNGHKWCPLANDIKQWDHDDNEGTPEVPYYWFSACCNGRQGKRLRADPVTFLPTCSPGMSSSACRAYHWRRKLYVDLGLLGPGEKGIYTPESEDFYDFRIISAPMKNFNPEKYHGFAYPGGRAACECAANSTHCMKTTKDGERCIWCKDVDMSLKCHEETMQIGFGLQFFKLHSVDLKSSLMSFQGWIRLDWVDERLSYDYQCYGGISMFEAQAQSGHLENTLLWTPDMELYNNEKSIWGDQFPSRLASVYSCWSGSPSRSGCGYVWWSRPSVVKALCKYGGLARFPMDVLKCELEFAAWLSAAHIQDFYVMSGRLGISWSDEAFEGNKHSMAGITGGSAYQDYKIKAIAARRDICVYACCPDPFPTLVYMLEFERSNYFYMMKLFLPSISITMLSFAAFFSDPFIFERLQFGVVVILANLMNDVTAMEMMPVTSTAILMDYVSMICLIFAVVSLAESGLALNLYFRTDRSCFHALMPVGAYKVYREMIRRLRLYLTPKDSHPEGHPQADIPTGRKGVFRVMLYREIFFALDKNHSGELDLVEFESFALSVLGFAAEGAQTAQATIDQFDVKGNGRLNFEEFVAFCEVNIKEKVDMSHLTKMLRGYVRAIDRENIAIRDMWKRRAIMVDTISRCGIPAGFLGSLLYVINLDEKDLEEIQSADKRESQWLISTSGLWVTAACCLIYLFYVIYRRFRRVPKKEKMIPAVHGIKDAFTPIQIQELKADKPEIAPTPLKNYPTPDPGEVDRLLKEALEEEEAAQKEEADQIPNDPNMQEQGNAVVVDFSAAAQGDGSDNGGVVPTQYGTKGEMAMEEHFV
jgi:hypothetical protein